MLYALGTQLRRAHQSPALVERQTVNSKQVTEKILGCKAHVQGTKMR